MKQVAMGRKAWLFVCSVTGGEQSAKMMNQRTVCGRRRDAPATHRLTMSL
jgi:hypothetical protein